MTQQTSQNMPPPKAEVAKQQAAEVGRTTADAGRHVAGTAVEQAGNVAQEAKRQARDLIGEARSQVTEQAQTGKQNAVEGIHSLAGELREMADGGDHHGPASQLAAQAADRLSSAADWIGAREPGDLLDEVRRLARRRPGAFLLGAAVAGVLAGRLTRGAVDAQRDTSSDTSGYLATSQTTPLPVVPSPTTRPAAPLSGYGSGPGVGSAQIDPLAAPPLPPYGEEPGNYHPGSVPPPHTPGYSAPGTPSYDPTSTTGADYIEQTERGTGPAPGGAR